MGGFCAVVDKARKAWCDSAVIAKLCEYDFSVFYGEWARAVTVISSERRFVI